MEGPVSQNCDMQYIKVLLHSVVRSLVIPFLNSAPRNEDVLKNEHIQSVHFMRLRKPSVSAELVEASPARILHARSQRYNFDTL
jgi:hypothetical protein